MDKEKCPKCGSDDLHWTNISEVNRFASLRCRKCGAHVREWNS